MVEAKKNKTQLISILKELEKTMIRKCLPLLYPRVIVDSWNHEDGLGIELLELAELYRKMKEQKGA